MACAVIAMIGMCVPARCSLRRIFFRSSLDTREVAILRGMMTQIDWASTGFDGRKRS